MKAIRLLVIFILSVVVLSSCKERRSYTCMCFAATSDSAITYKSRTDAKADATCRKLKNDMSANSCALIRNFE